MNSTKVHKQSKKREKKQPNLEEELNIRYHDFNPEWNYTISPKSQQTKDDEK